MVEGCCPALHGEAVRAGTATFGCTDGGLEVTVKGKTVTSRKIANPAGTPEGTRVGTVAAHDRSPAPYGNFGTCLVRWEPGGADLTPVPLSAAPLKFTFAPDG